MQVFTWLVGWLGKVIQYLHYFVLSRLFNQQISELLSCLPEPHLYMYLSPLCPATSLVQAYAQSGTLHLKCEHAAH